MRASLERSGWENNHRELLGRQRDMLLVDTQLGRHSGSLKRLAKRRVAAEGSTELTDTGHAEDRD